MELRVRHRVAAIGLILVTAFWLWASLPEQQTFTVYSSSGVWDLSGFDFANAAIIRGRVDYLPVGFLEPDEFAGMEDVVSRRYPVLSAQAATVRLRLVMPCDGYYVITRIGTGYADRIFVNGQWLMDVGRPDDGPGDVRFAPNITFVARAENGVIEILHQQSNFSYIVHGIYGGGLDEIAISSRLRQVEYTTNIMLGFLLALAVVFLLLYLLLYRYPPALFFSLFCIMWFMAVGALGEPNVFKTIFPWLSDPMRFRFTVIIITGTSALLYLIVNGIIPGVYNKHVFRIVVGMTTLWTVYYLFAGIEAILSHGFLVGGIMTVVAVGYSAVVTLKKFRPSDPQQFMLISGVTIMGYAAVRDIFYLLNVNIAGTAILLPPFSGTNFTRVGAASLFLCLASAVFLAATRELEKSRQAQQQLAAENAALENLTRMKTEFLQDIRHEVRNPLNNISLGTDFVNQYIDDESTSQEARNALNTMQNEVLRLGRMINGMVELATMDGDAVSRERVDFAAMLKHCAEASRMMIEQKNNKLFIDIAPDMPFVYAQPEQLARIPDNLLSNAARSTQGGEITLKAWADTRFITVEISDTGEGIPAELLPLIFERGISGKGGRGYGLPMCKTIAEAHGGAIGIESQPGEGAVATFTIPIYGGQSEAISYGK
ncbi:MAG: HAMP domain-containing histidine kinase [Defluviitaleaceae bacterium]|nr:HAMP domain-containing histidine kinase [Defluviitaleaceae bacterium]